MVRFVNLRPTTKSINIRLPESLISKIKVMANSVDVPYQSYMKTILADKVREISHANEYRAST